MLKEFRRRLKERTPIEKQTYISRHWWVGVGIAWLGDFLAWLAVKLGIAANTVSLANLGVTVLCFILLAVGESPWFAIGGVLLNLWIIFDVVDGKIARATQSISPSGHFLDSVGAWLMYALLLPSIGVGLARTGVSLHVGSFGLGGSDWVLIGLVGAVAQLLWWASVFVYDATFSSQQDRAEADSLNDETGRTSFVPPPVQWVRDNLFSLCGFVPPLVLVFILLGWVHVYLMVLSLWYAAQAILGVSSLIWRAWRCA
jgi:CDP-alcohol phosphatidyltransferase-like enzyme